MIAALMLWGVGGINLKITIVYDVGDSPPGIPTLLKYL